MHVTGRVAVVVLLLFGTAVMERAVSGAEADVPRESMQTLPLAFDGWQGRAAAPLAKDVVALLGVDEHVYRTYFRDGIPVNLYAGYYQSQRRGDTIHSPQNCLPGAGWQPVSAGHSGHRRRWRTGARESVRDSEGHATAGRSLLVPGPRPRGRERVHQ